MYPTIEKIISFILQYLRLECCCCQQGSKVELKIPTLMCTSLIFKYSFNIIFSQNLSSPLRSPIYYIYHNIFSISLSLVVEMMGILGLHHIFF